MYPPPGPGAGRGPRARPGLEAWPGCRRGRPRNPANPENAPEPPGAPQTGGAATLVAPRTAERRSTRLEWQKPASWHQDETRKRRPSPCGSEGSIPRPGLHVPVVGVFALSLPSTRGPFPRPPRSQDHASRVPKRPLSCFPTPGVIERDRHGNARNHAGLRGRACTWRRGKRHVSQHAEAPMHGLTRPAGWHATCWCEQWHARQS